LLNPFLKKNQKSKPFTPVPILRNKPEGFPNASEEPRILKICPII